MIRKNDMRHVVAIVWLISFVIMWSIFSVRLPKSDFNLQLNQIEQSISKKDWKQAKISMEELKRIYTKNKALIQVNNATEILTTFDYTLGQLDASVQYEQDEALEYIGGLKWSLNYVMKSFPGP